jgi:hypothetical protein
LWPEQGEFKMDHFTPVDALDASNFLREVIQSDGSGVLNFLMPVTGFEANGQSVTPQGFDQKYGIYITINATHPAGNSGIGGVFSSLNLTLWADPKNDDGTASVSQSSGPSFSNGMTNDIVLATGTMVSASVSQDPSGTRHADDVVSLTPTLEGTLLLGGSIKPGSLLEVNTTTPTGNFFQSMPAPDGTSIATVTDGTAVVTLDPQGTILVPNITPEQLQLADVPRFIHGDHGHHGGDRRGHDR